jgi:cytochrome c-type biogenesis protein CcmE
MGGEVGPCGPVESAMDSTRTTGAAPEPRPGGDRPVPDQAEGLPIERQTHRGPLALLGVVVLVALAWAVIDAFQGSVVYYLTPTEAVAEAPEEVFRLAGEVAEGSIVRDDATGSLRFDVTDGTTTVPVRFDGARPDNLADGAEAVSEGRFASDGVFEAERVLARCASRFESELEVP